MVKYRILPPDILSTSDFGGYDIFTKSEVREYPPCRRTILMRFYKTVRNDMPVDLVYEKRYTLWFPYQIFALKNNHLYVGFSSKQNEKNTTLVFPPFPNIYCDFRVCLGNTLVSDMDSCISSFWQSEFNEIVRYISCPNAAWEGTTYLLRHFFGDNARMQSTDPIPLAAQCYNLWSQMTLEEVNVLFDKLPKK
jgi:hypothetical protein